MSGVAAIMATADHRWDLLCAAAEAMQAHPRAEEDLLFPAAEARTGISAGPARIMGEEHGRIRGLIADLVTCAEGHDPEVFPGAAGTLHVLVRQRNMKAEQAPYPLADRALGAETAGLCVGPCERLGD